MLKSAIKDAVKSANIAFIIVILAFSSFVAAAVILFSINEIDNRENEIQDKMQIFVGNLNYRNQTFLYQAKALSNAAVVLHREIQSRKLNEEQSDSIFKSFLNKAVLNFPESIGMGVWFEPQKLFPKIKYYGVYSYKRNSKIIFTKNYSNPEYDYFSWNWYQTGTLDNKTSNYDTLVRFSEPFFDSGETKELMITTASPIINENGDFLGITSVDISLVKLMKIIGDLRVTPKSNSIIIHKDSELIVSYTADTNYMLKNYKALDFLKNISFNKYKSLQKQKIRYKGEKYFLYFSNTSAGFIYGIIISENEFYSPIYKFLFIYISIGIILTIIVVFSLKFFLNNIVRLSQKNNELKVYFANIMNTSPDCILIQDEKDNIIDANSTFFQVFGYNKSKISKINFSDLFTNYEGYSDYLTYSDFSFESKSFEEYFNIKNGIVIPFLIRKREMILNNKRFFLIVMTNISENKKNELEIKELNAELENRVIERTEQLKEALNNLEREIETRMSAEDDLLMSNEELTMLNRAIADDSRKLSLLNEELLLSEKRLNEANTSKDKFFSILAHDLKNPLHAIQLSLSLLLTDHYKMNKENMIDLIKNMDKAVKHLMTLLENLLLWSRSQSGRLEFHPVSVNILDIIEKSVNLISPAIEKKGINISISIHQEIKVIADINMLEAIIRNLLTNAVKFSHPNGNIQIAGEIKNDLAFISLIDNGIGMREDVLNSLFKIDVVNTQNGTQNEKGTGLGLLICKEFIERHGGSISVKSELNKGSVFTFSVPYSAIL